MPVTPFLASEAPAHCGSSNNPIVRSSLLQEEQSQDENLAESHKMPVVDMQVVVVAALTKYLDRDMVLETAARQLWKRGIVPRCSGSRWCYSSHRPWLEM